MKEVCANLSKYVRKKKVTKKKRDGMAFFI
jgi:hypothetical protein